MKKREIVIEEAVAGMSDESKATIVAPEEVPKVEAKPELAAFNPVAAASYSRVRPELVVTDPARIQEWKDWAEYVHRTSPIGDDPAPTAAGFKAWLAAGKPDEGRCYALSLKRDAENKAAEEARRMVYARR